MTNFSSDSPAPSGCETKELTPAYVGTPSYTPVSSNFKTRTMTDTNQFEFPNGTDILFNKSNIDYRHNAIIKSGIDQFFLFSDSYKIGARKLFEQLDGNAINANTLVYPIVFLCRHFIELRLKELISGLNYTNSEEYSFPNGHSLTKLWGSYKAVIPLMGDSLEPDSLILQNTERLILEFDMMDPGSMCFRYPVDKSALPSLQISMIDLENFQQSMNKIFNFLDSQSDIVFHIIDTAEDYFTGIRMDYYQEMMSNYN